MALGSHPIHRGLHAAMISATDGPLRSIPLLKIALYQNMAEDHTSKGVGACHPYREFEGMQPSREMQTSLASTTGVSPWVSTFRRGGEPWFMRYCWSDPQC